MILIENYWMGRDVTHAADLTPEIQARAVKLLKAVNAFIGLAVADGVVLHKHPRTGTYVSSGWRPPSVNSGVPGAAKKSKHMLGGAVDVYDPGDILDEWIYTHFGLLAASGLWLEHPDSTPGWSHLQDQPPASKRRIFRP